MKITKILQKPNQFPEVNEKYEPLKKNIKHLKQPVVQENIQNKSYVSHRLRSLSPNQAQIIKSTTFIPENCRLKVTSNQQKQKNAFSQKYIAINMEQKTRSKPISPNTFQTIVKNKKVEVVYQYSCSNANGVIQHQNQGSVQTKNIGKKERQNYLLKNQNQFESNNLQNPNLIYEANLQSPRTQTSIVNQVINYGPSDSQNLRQNQSPSQRLIRDNTSPNSRTKISNDKGNIYTDQNNQNSRNSHYVANEQSLNYDGPAFFQTEGRSKYNQMGKNSKRQYEVKTKNSQYPGKIQIGGRSKSSTKQTFQDFQSNIGINSRHDILGSKDFSKNYAPKQDALQGQQTEVKGEYYVENQLNGTDDKSRVGDYAQNVQSRLVFENNGNSNKKNGKKAQKVKEVDFQQYNAENPIDQESPQLLQSSPEIQQRKRKLREYQQSGSRGYTFKRNQDSDQRRKKDDYKYNLFSMCDQQFNLKCATGIFKPNQICASEPKRQGWN